MKGKTVSLDGKTVRGASAMNPNNPVHIVSAWVGENQMVLAQTRVGSKRNEISALKELLEILELKGSTVTIDAMGCQVKIAERIVGKGADYGTKRVSLKRRMLKAQHSEEYLKQLLNVM